MSQLNIEKNLENAWIDFLSLNAVLDNQPIPIRNWRDNSQERQQKLVIVHAKPAKQEFPGAPLFACEVELICMTYIEDDTDRSGVTSLYEAILLVARETTKEDLTNHISSNVSILGIESAEGDENDDENGFQIMTVKLTLHIQTT